MFGNHRPQPLRAPPRENVREWKNRPGVRLAHFTTVVAAMSERTAVSQIEANIPALRRYAWSLLRNAADADDLVQDCLLRALDRVGSLQREGDLRPWLFTIMHNLFASRWRRMANRARLFNTQAEADTGIAPAQEAILRDAVGWKGEEPVPATLSAARLAEAHLRQRSTPWRIAAGIVVAVGIGAGAGWIAHTPDAGSGIASVAMEASVAQRVFATDPLHPVEFNADEQAALVHWASLRLGRAVAGPDLSKAGYRLLGGRIVGTEHGAGCMLLYQSTAGVRISLFVRPMHDVDMNARMRPVQEADTAGFV